METENRVELDESDLYERFDELLNEVYPLVKFGQLSYEPAEVLKSVDPIAYREDFNNWLDSEVDEIDGKYYQKD